MRDFDCKECGACCMAGDGLVTVVTASDRKRLPVIYQQRYVTYRKGLSVPILAEKRTADGVVCVALDGSVGEKVSCSIYNTRPTCCRVFVVGSGECIERRIHAGI